MGTSGGVKNRGKEDDLHDDAWRGKEQEDRLVGLYFVALRERMPATIDNSVPRTSFSDWLRNRPEDAPQADRLSLLIAQAGEGISLDRLRRLCGLPGETLDDLLKALTATGQVRMLRVNGELVYRAAG
jgi:hypothetical protein